MRQCWLVRLAQVCREEFPVGDVRTWFANLLPSVIPVGVGGRLRSTLYRALGMQVGAATLIVGPITLGTFPGAVRRIRLGARCFVNSHVFIDASAPVWVGDHVSIGHHVVIVTTNHAIGPAYHRAGRLTSAPVTIESGAWVAAGALLLPGVTVGSGAVVAAGAVVASDVPAHTLVAGVPAKVIRHLDDETQGRDTPHDTQQIGTDRCI